MKKIFVSLLLTGVLSFSVKAQVKTPQPSPTCEIEQTVGLTNFEIEYSRPGAKGRTVFGDLVPYGKIWRTGANKATQFEVNTDVKVNGKELKAGKYAIFTKPGKDSWDVYWYNETEIWGTPDSWVDSLVACSVNVKPQSLNDMVESFTIAWEDVSNGAYGTLAISWEKTKISLKIEVPTEDLAMKSIEQTMAGPSANDYYRAASYYLEIGKELDQARTWITKACEMKGTEPFWYWRKKSLIEAKLGMYADAIKSAQTSLESAKKAGNDDYVKMNTESIAEWEKKK
ncbi:DUF2911 domain-containing protein [Paracrocinitomix mangrovi]|uniref:DUF2911 domain-containing protein n=1 Tax=Paracrocinitomix mangrovi TaxID=2862509 RepID=UPI001C8E20A8|nr:DUF2911 domain-containing protein [Paracrocinitomix mangrovi]UKN02355.1 DUF2911 domain-containing protein [Paracrocinitomix mangrovi]